MVFKEKPKSIKFQDIEGQKFGMLTVVGFIGINKRGNSIWCCKCECGSQWVTVHANNLKNGHTKSCGCLHLVRIEEVNTKHGHKRTNNVSRVYSTWISMKRRCHSPKCKHYLDYGGRGITVCDRWQKFENFLEDMGEPWKGMSIDRIDVNGNYELSNCRWATKKEQANNTRRNHLLTLNGRTQTMTQWAEEIGIKSPTLRHRLRAGWSIERALTE